MHSLTIAPRVNGPPASGNGGYVCGLLAREIDGPAEAALRVPPPLDKPLTVSRDGARVLLHDGAILVGEAKSTTLDLTAAPAPSLGQARDAAKRYAGLHHAFPTCFVCGASRVRHDGLDIFTGKLSDRDMVACTWTPAADLADADGRVAPEFIHAALDCPGYWALPGAGQVVAVLARFSVSIDAAPPHVGEELIVAAWHLSSEGRKHKAASALYDARGAVLARAEALWIELKDPPAR
ncbi:MAG: hypothetical protein M0D54_19195 [Hyphomonadaceae bacterium JAD_PAG50586_4]|nr:MAG: hypothetical protein M0D54_19195 [Hyphomonadaceae bacterium JAD_PAG50586_4]